MTCTQAVAQLWHHLERETAPPPGFDEHLDQCRRCCGEAEFAGLLRGFLVEHTVDGIPVDARRRLDVFLDDLEDRPWPT